MENSPRKANKPLKDDLPPLDDLPDEYPVAIGNGPLKRKIEATIKDYSLNREEVKKWMQEKTGQIHFSDLTEDHANRLLAAIPRLAAQQLIKSVYALPQDELERLGGDPPTWLNHNETDWLMKAVSHRLKTLHEEATHVPPGPDSEPTG